MVAVSFKSALQCWTKWPNARVSCAVNTRGGGLPDTRFRSSCQPSLSP